MRSRSKLNTLYKVFDKMYWGGKCDCSNLHQMLWSIPENCEFVVKNSRLVWRKKSGK